MARRSKEEVHELAKSLNQRCQIFRDGLQALSRKDYVSVEAEDGVRRQCEQLEDRLRHLQEERSSLSSDLAIDDVERLTAQLAVWKQQKVEDTPTSIPTASVLLMQLQHVVRRQQELLAVTRGTRLSLDQELKREQQLLQESQQMKNTLETKLKQSQTKDDTGQELIKKIEAMEQQYDMLQQKLKYFLHTYIPLPNEEQPTRMKKGKRTRQATLDNFWKTSQENQPSPEEMIMTLIDQAIHNPRDPYVQCDELFAQLLQRVGIVQCHPDNPTLIRITPFHHEC